LCWSGAGGGITRGKIFLDKSSLLKLNNNLFFRKKNRALFFMKGGKDSKKGREKV